MALMEYGEKEAVDKDKQGQVHMVINQIDKNLDSFDSVIDTLTARLKPALKPERPSEEHEKETSLCESPLVSHLFEIKNRIGREQVRVGDLLDRLEL